MLQSEHCLTMLFAGAPNPEPAGTVELGSIPFKLGTMQQESQRHGRPATAPEVPPRLGLCFFRLLSACNNMITHELLQTGRSRAWTVGTCVTLSSVLFLLSEDFILSIAPSARPLARPEWLPA